MPDSRFAPRNLAFDALVGVLVEEHRVMREGLLRAKEAASRRDFEAVSRALRDLDPVFRQHIADEESQILRLLVGQLGVKGAAEEIRVFQQHRPIYQLMQSVGELASKEAVELEVEQSKLGTLFDNRTTAEEGAVFPEAPSLYKQFVRR
jgi:hypothetical protein